MPSRPRAFRTPQELGPERLRLGRSGAEPNDLAPSIGVHGHSYYGSNADDPPALADLQVGRVEPEIGPVAGERAVQELADAVVDVLAELRHGALRDAAEPHGLHQLVDPPGGDATNPSLLNDSDKGLLGRPARLEEAREVGALPQLRDAQVQRAEPGVERTVAVAVAIGDAPLGTLVTPGADHALHIGLHDQLQHRLGDGSEEVPFVVLLQKLGQGHDGLGHRGLRSMVGEVAKLHRRLTPRWPPRPTPQKQREIPPPPRTLPSSSPQSPSLQSSSIGYKS